MAELTFTEGQVSPVNEFEYEAWTLVALTAFTVGQSVAIDTDTGMAVLADATALAPNNVRGIVIWVNGNRITVMVHGTLAGYDLSGLDYDAPVYQSDTPGVLADTAGSVSVVVGRVKPMHDSNSAPTKVLYVNIPALM